MKNLLNSIRELFNALGNNWKPLAACGLAYLAYVNVPGWYTSARERLTKTLVEQYINDHPITVQYSPATRKEAAHIADTSTGLAGDYIYIVWELETRLLSCQGDLKTIQELVGNNDYRLASMKENKNG